MGTSFNVIVPIDIEHDNQRQTKIRRFQVEASGCMFPGRLLVCRSKGSRMANPAGCEAPVCQSQYSEGQLCRFQPKGQQIQVKGADRL